MNAVREQFRTLVLDHSAQVGFAAPELLLEYLTDILVERFDRPDFVPTPSFAESYLRLYSVYRPGPFREFADSTLIFCSLQPDYGQRRGIPMDYYATLGISTYYTLADFSHDSRFTQLGNWFYHIQKFLCSMLHPDRRLQLLNIQ
jgi:hypothetical protein